MAKKKNKAYADPLMQRAIALAQQQYGSQASTIVQAIKQAGSQRVATVRQARAGGKAGAAAETQAGRDLVGQLGQVGAAAQQNSGYVDKLLAQPSATSATGPGAALIAAIGNSRANLPVNVAYQQADATKRAGERSTRAREGAVYAENAANAGFAGTVENLRGQLKEVQNAQGLKVSTTYQDLLDKANRDARADAGLDIQRQRANNETTRTNLSIDKDTYQRQHGLGPYKPPKKTGRGGPTPTQALNARTKIEQYVAAYKDGIQIEKPTDTSAGKFWTLAQAKKGILADGTTASKLTAVKRYEQRVRDNMTTKLGKRLANAVAQTVVYHGVGRNTRHLVYKDYGVKLPLFTRPKPPGWRIPMALPQKG